MPQTPNLPELYTQEQLDALEAHILKHYGSFENVFHEIVSPDIHVDIAIIPPTPEHDYYTLVTMGMGAHRMNVPQALKEDGLDRAELLICLPGDWNLQSSEEADYWPMRWLKILARLPGEQDTWLGWGHSVPNDGPFAANTRLEAMLLLTPGAFYPEAYECALPGGEAVNFYQLVPLYPEEIAFKLEHDTQELIDRMTPAMLECVDLNRPNACE